MTSANEMVDAGKEPVEADLESGEVLMTKVRFYRKELKSGDEKYMYLCPPKAGPLEASRALPLPNMYTSGDFEKAIVNADRGNYLANAYYYLEDYKKMLHCDIPTNNALRFYSLFFAHLFSFWSFAMQIDSSFKDEVIEIAQTVCKTSPENFRFFFFQKCQAAPELFGLKDNYIRSIAIFRAWTQFEKLRLCHILRLTYGQEPFINYHFPLELIEAVEKVCEKWNYSDYEECKSYAQEVEPEFSFTDEFMLRFPELA